jgi:hypothetical protein
MRTHSTITTFKLHTAQLRVLNSRVLVLHISTHTYTRQKETRFKVVRFEVLTAMVGLFFDHEDGGDMFLRNVG